MNPMEGINVLDFSRALAGPYCAQLLAELGANVIKVESINGDDARNFGPPFIDGESSVFLCANQNKKNIVIDFKSENGKEIIWKMIKDSDVLIENYRPFVMEEYGLDYEHVKKVKKDIIYCSISAWGSTGPYKDHPGVDSIMQGMSGLAMLSGEEGAAPVRIGAPIIDVATGVYGALGISSALLVRNRTGLGQKIELSLLNIALMLQLPRVQEYLIFGKQPERTGLLSTFGVIGGYFNTKDGYISISIINDKYWRILCRVIGMSELIEDEKYKKSIDRIERREEVYSMLENVFKGKTAIAWKEIFEKEGLLSGMIYKYEDLFNDKNLLCDDFVEYVPHSNCGNIKGMKFPINFTNCNKVKKFGSPIYGEHTEEILKNYGYDCDTIEKLRKEKTIKTSVPLLII